MIATQFAGWFLVITTSAGSHAPNVTVVDDLADKAVCESVARMVIRDFKIQHHGTISAVCHPKGATLQQ